MISLSLGLLRRAQHGKAGVAHTDGLLDVQGGDGYEMRRAALAHHLAAVAAVVAPLGKVEAH